jgi:hypothetical protein
MFSPPPELAQQTHSTLVFDHLADVAPGCSSEWVTFKKDF